MESVNWWYGVAYGFLVLAIGQLSLILGVQTWLKTPRDPSSETRAAGGWKLGLAVVAVSFKFLFLFLALFLGIRRLHLSPVAIVLGAAIQLGLAVIWLSRHIRRTRIASSSAG